MRERERERGVWFLKRRTRSPVFVEIRQEIGELLERRFNHVRTLTIKRCTVRECTFRESMQTRDETHCKLARVHTHLFSTQLYTPICSEHTRIHAPVPRGDCSLPLPQGGRCACLTHLYVLRAWRAWPPRASLQCALPLRACALLLLPAAASQARPIRAGTGHH